MKRQKIVIGITGASGALYAKLLIEKIITLHQQVDVCDLIFSDNARSVWAFELGDDPGRLLQTVAAEDLPGSEVTSDNIFPGGREHQIRIRQFDPGNFFAPMASGSAGYDTMIVCPCTMGTLGRIAAGLASDLMTRAADVMLKERRRLILVPRETPYNLIHLSTMKLLTEAGAIICPATPSFYSKPATVESLAMTVVDRILSLAGFDFKTYHWGE